MLMNGTVILANFSVSCDLNICRRVRTSDGLDFAVIIESNKFSKVF